MSSDACHDNAREWSFFRDERHAYHFVEARFWPNGPVCPRCSTSSRIGRLCGASTRIGLYKCYECGKPFTVKIGTIFEGSHIPLHIWLQALYLIRLGHAPISPFRLHRILGVTPRTAVLMVQRIQASAEASCSDTNSGSMKAHGNARGDRHFGH
jgi:transposase-like protein